MLIDLLRARRSIRRFTAQPVAADHLDLLVEAGLRAFSSKGNNPWEFIVVTDRELIGQLAAAKAHGSTFLAGAPLAIVVCADPAASDVWVEDASIAATLLHLEAVDLGLGSCWVQIRLRGHDQRTSAQEYVASLLGLPKGLMVEAIIGIGHPVESKSGHPEDSLPRAKVSYQRYGQREGVQGTGR